MTRDEMKRLADEERAYETNVELDLRAKLNVARSHVAQDRWNQNLSWLAKNLGTRVDDEHRQKN